MSNGKKKGNAIRHVSKALNTVSYIVMVVGISLMISAFGILLANDMFALIKEDQTIVLVLDEDCDLKEMSQLLLENEVIEFGWAFRLYADIKNIETFKKGTYEISSGMDYGQIIDTMIHPKKILETVMVTIPEGFNIRQIAELMEKKGVCKGDELIETANTYEFRHTVLKDVPMVENRLEGYLFPDTYEFYINENTVSVLNKMLNNFVKKYTKEMKNLTEAREMTMADIIIIASLIEREAKIAGERTTISGVIYNRLAKPDSFPFLQIDATVVYALKDPSGRLSLDDLKIDSPYNTYTNKGLPPTAICNPGVSSILAAISPEKHDYYYYVVNDLELGSHAFAKTEKQHQANVEAYQKLLKEQP